MSIGLASIAFPEPMEPIARTAVHIGEDAGYLALLEISRHTGPVGCWRIRAALQVSEIRMSEATAGRLLRKLDDLGYTRSMGSRGRVLTKSGKLHLEALEEARVRSVYQTDLLDAVRAETIEDILDLLGARRVVEAETARLAATRASDREITEIEKAVLRHADAVRDRQTASAENRSLHLLIAKASRSRVLAAMASLMLQDRGLQDSQTAIQRVSGQVSPSDHLRILQAIKNRKADQAAGAMCGHIDRLLRVVQDYSTGSHRFPDRLGDAESPQP
jgi:GntR family transcriptional regulator, transcriptional repressor for pyruvate dehydrogenase complex